jgi:hypothetical protein
MDDGSFAIASHNGSLLYDLRDHTSPYRMSTLTNGKP